MVLTRKKQERQLEKIRVKLEIGWYSLRKKIPSLRSWPLSSLNFCPSSSSKSQDKNLLWPLILLFSTPSLQTLLFNLVADVGPSTLPCTVEDYFHRLQVFSSCYFKRNKKYISQYQRFGIIHQITSYLLVCKNIILSSNLYCNNI